MIRGLYTHRDSWLHRQRPGAKLLALPLVGTLIFVVSSPLAGAAILAVSVLAYRAADLSLATAWQQLRPVLLVIALVFLAQAFLATVQIATLSVLRIATLVLLAALVTLTTRTRDLVDTLEWSLAPLAPLGVDPAKVGLAISLAIRFIPVIAGIFGEVREAQAARGGGRNALRLVMPTVIRTLRMTDEIADAIDARS